MNLVGTRARFSRPPSSAALVTAPLPHGHYHRRIGWRLGGQLGQQMSEHTKTGWFHFERRDLPVERPAMLGPADGTLTVDRNRQHLGVAQLLEMQPHRVGVQMEALGYLEGGQSLTGLGHLLVDRLSRGVRQHL
jgi:hypothetical protein